MGIKKKVTGLSYSTYREREREREKHDKCWSSQ
jgi:hypothetical protein